MNLKPALIVLLLNTIPYTVQAGEGHDAGYQWAEENEIDDTASCSTPSSSFNEGCEEYVEENETPTGSTYDDDEEEDE